jgi:gamma-glutamyltranspeptidase / glutathione hydrolase
MLRESLALLAGASTLPAMVSGLAAAEPRGGGRGAVATSQAEAAKAAADILRKGGNAVDAAVASMMTLCVVQPSSVGIGGYGGSMVLHMAKQKLTTSIDFDSRVPVSFRPETFGKGEQAYHGYLAVGVPGVVAGLDLALRRFGTLPWKTVARHAIGVAEEGIPVDTNLRKAFEALQKNMDRTSFLALFPDGIMPDIGQRWKQTDLARLLRELGKTGADAFYRGEIARTIARQMQENGGALSEEDLRNYQARVEDPLRITYRGYELRTPRPPSGGITALSILKTLENFDLASLEPWGAEYFHLFAETAKLCWGERFTLVGDPDVVSVPMDDLLSDAQGAARAEIVRADEVACFEPDPLIEKHTANTVVVDRDCNAVSLTATHGGGFGAQVAIRGLGLVLGHGMSRFSTDPKSPNYPSPGKRVMHNMSPLVALRDGKPTHVVGLPGGRTIANVTAQMVSSMVDFGASPAKAVKGPFIHTEGNEPLQVPESVSARVVAQLESMGHSIKRVKSVGGSVNAALIDTASGRVTTASGKGPEGVVHLG